MLIKYVFINVYFVLLNSMISFLKLFYLLYIIRNIKLL